MPSKPSKLTPKRRIEFEAIGTWWDISVPSGIIPTLEEDIHTFLGSFDQKWSRFRADSEVTRLSQHAGTLALKPEETELLRWYQSLYSATNGAVTPLIGQTLADAGYDANYALTPHASIHQTPTWKEVIRLEEDTIHLLTPALIDIGAAGKGFAIDQIAGLIESQGHTAYTIDASGDIRVGTNTETIGFEHPLDPSKVIGATPLTGGSICGSAVNRRAWGDWHHIINPHNSRPATKIVATWTIADSAMKADGLATALFFTQPDKLAHLSNFSYVIVHEDGTILYSKNKQIRLFTE